MCIYVYIYMYIYYIHIHTYIPVGGCPRPPQNATEGFDIFIYVYI